MKRPMFPDVPNVVWYPDKVIPKGPYCYDERGVCPCWGRSEHHPEQENGYCTYMLQRDWLDDGIPLLWDQVKCCGVNMEREDDELP